MAEARKFWNPRASVIFTWAGEEDLVLSYDAQRIVVPGRDKVAVVEEGTPYTHEAVRDTANRRVPGTIVVEDITDDLPGGGFKTRFSVDLLCRFLQRDREDLFNRGFNIVASRGDVAAALEQGLPLYAKSQDERARMILATELERQKRFTDKGQPPPPSSSGHLVDWAIQHLAARPAEVVKYGSDEITKVLEGKYVPAPTPAPVVEAAVVAKSANKTLYQEAVEAGVKLSKGELEGLLVEDPETVRFVVEKIKVRREAAEPPVAETAERETVGPLV